MFVNELEDQDNDNNNNNNHDNKVDNYISKSNVINSDDLKSTVSTTTATATANKIEKKEEKEEREGKNHQISFKSVNSCKICNLSIIIKTKKTSSTIHHPFSIKSLKSYLITSDIIKISSESNNTKNSITNNNDNSSIMLTGSHYKKYFIEGIQIQPRIFWKSNIGELVYGNLGQSSIYYTPGESELSKSPITINLYFQYDHDVDDLQHAILSDSKKLWILRQPPLRLF
jgi:hypothetical protein